MTHPRAIPLAAIPPSRTRVLLEVIAFERNRGYCPRVRDICAATGMAVSTVHGHLTTLRADGLVSWDEGRRGTLRSLVGVVG